MIKFDDVELAYSGKKVLSGLSLEIKQGEKVAVLGRSGLGKSSLFAMLFGFVQPVSGKIFFEDVRVDEESAWNVRRKIAFIDQDVSLGVGRVSDWIAFVFGLRANLSLDSRPERIKELMSFFDLGHDLLDKDVVELSGGERQRMAIVIAVLLGRQVFLLDEITSALDKRLKEKVVDFFVREQDWTVVVVSHDAVWLDNPAVKVFDLEAAKWAR